MVRIILILAVLYGAWWCWNNVDFNSMMNNAANTVQNEKTIKAVTQGRQNRSQDIDNALGN